MAGFACGGSCLHGHRRPCTEDGDAVPAGSKLRRTRLGWRRTSLLPEQLHKSSGECLQVLFYGQFIPLHGIGTIIEAARLLRDAPIQWTLVGRGQEAPRIRAMLAEY